MGKQTIVVLALAPLFIGVARAEEPAARDATPLLKCSELSGTYRGKSTVDDVAVELLVKFRGSDRAMPTDNVWFRQNFNGPKRYGVIAGQIQLIDHAKSGTVQIRCDYVVTKTGKRGSAIIGKIQYDRAGATYFTLLPESSRFGLRNHTTRHTNHSRDESPALGIVRSASQDDGFSRQPFTPRLIAMQTTRGQPAE